MKKLNSYNDLSNYDLKKLNNQIPLYNSLNYNVNIKKSPRKKTEYPVINKLKLSSKCTNFSKLINSIDDKFNLKQSISNEPEFKFTEMHNNVADLDI